MRVIVAGPQYGRGPGQEQPSMVFLHGFGGRAGYLRISVRTISSQTEDVLFEHPAVAVVQVKWIPDEEGVIHLRGTLCCAMACM